LGKKTRKQLQKFEKNNNKTKQNQTKSNRKSTQIIQQCGTITWKGT